MKYTLGLSSALSPLVFTSQSQQKESKTVVTLMSMEIMTSS